MPACGGGGGGQPARKICGKTRVRGFSGHFAVYSFDVRDQRLLFVYIPLSTAVPCPCRPLAAYTRRRRRMCLSHSARRALCTLHAAPFRTSYLWVPVGMEGCRTTRASSRSRVGSEAAGTRTASTSSDGFGRNTANSVLGTADCPSPSDAAFDDPPSDDPHNQGNGGADSDDDR